MALKTKVFIVTGYHDEEKEAKTKELGADGYLVKPLTIQKLIEIAKSTRNQKS